MRTHVLAWAEAIDAARVVPRLLIGGYCWWSVKLITWLVDWYTRLPTADRTINDAGFVAAVIGAITGFGVPIFRIYSQNGRNWKKHPPCQY